MITDLNCSQLEKENAKLQATLKALKEEAIKSFKPRTPKKLTDLTTKLQMKRMVEDLENEIGTYSLCFKMISVLIPVSVYLFLYIFNSLENSILQNYCLLICTS